MWISKRMFNDLISKLNFLSKNTEDINIKISNSLDNISQLNFSPTVAIKNTSTNSMPDYASAGAAGMDLRAFLSESIILKPLSRVLIPTGLYMQLPEGFEAQIRPRSGLAFKNGITVLNAPGTIDSDYLGEIGIVLINLSDESFTINNGDRIAQMVIAPYSKVLIKSTDVFIDTVRGEGGFGHTGIK